MSKWYKTARKNYLSGQWNDSMLENVLQKGRITQDEYDAIKAEKAGKAAE